MKIRYIVVVALLWMFGACENDPYYWGEADYVRITGPNIYTNDTDSMTFTFSTLPLEIVEYDVVATLIIQGNVVDYDRDINLQVNPTKTTAGSSLYSFPEKLTLKAGEDSLNFNITIYRTAELTSQDVRLCVEIAPTGDLQMGVTSNGSLSIIWNDKITKPSNWDEHLTDFFGTYSEVKYRFIISTLGVSLFPYGEAGAAATGWTWGKMWNYRLKMITALEEYNNNPSNPNRPMRDENGGIINF